MLAYNFEDLKTIALRGRNKNIGKRLGRYNLLYGENDNMIYFYYLEENHINYNLLTIDSNNIITLNAHNNELYQSTRYAIEKYFDIVFKTINSQERQKYSSNVHFTLPNNRNIIYIPKQTKFKMPGSIIQAGTYQKYIINKEWNNKFTQLSRTFREQLATKDKFLDGKNNGSIWRNLPVDTVWEHLQNQEVTEEILIQWRHACDPYKPLRKAAQELINQYRWSIAKQEKAIHVEVINQNEQFNLGRTDN